VFARLGVASPATIGRLYEGDPKIRVD
jgi:hypothetical protein